MKSSAFTLASKSRLFGYLAFYAEVGRHQKQSKAAFVEGVYCIQPREVSFTMLKQRQKIEARRPSRTEWAKNIKNSALDNVGVRDIRFDIFNDFFFHREIRNPNPKIKN